MSFKRYIQTDYSAVQSIKGVREPCMCLRELSKDKGVPYTTLWNKFKKSESKPLPQLKGGNTTFYNMRLLLEWYDLNFNLENKE